MVLGERRASRAIRSFLVSKFNYSELSVIICHMDVVDFAWDIRFRS